MRWLVGACPIVLVTVLAISHAFAIVISEPPIRRVCTEDKDWPSIERCLTKHGLQATVLRTIGKTRLVRVVEPGPRDAGLVLYTEKNHRMTFSGIWDPAGATYEVLAFEALTRQGRTGYRIDIGESEPIRALIFRDAVPALRMRTHAVFCNANSAFCADAITSCDTFVHGKALRSFRGTLLLDASSVHVEGDRSNALSECAAPLQLGLGW